MKIFNVSLRVQIQQIGEIPDNPETPEPEPPKPFNDDPLDKQEKIMTKYLDRLAAMNAPFPGVRYAQESESAGIIRSVRVQAETFEDLSAILKKFSDTLTSLPEVDASLLKVCIPSAPITPSFG